MESFTDISLPSIIDLEQSDKSEDYNTALQLNQEMQKKLLELKNHLTSLLATIELRQIENVKKLQDYNRNRERGIGVRGAYLKGGTFYYKGNMFFKDRKLRNCPNNPDYVERSRNGEMFPMDFELRGRHTWTVADKVAIVQGIKEQILTHINMNPERRVNHKNGTQKKLHGNIALHTQKLATLLSQVDDKFEIDFHQIAAINVRHRHKESSCKAMWNVYLKPKIKRTGWTSDDNQSLLQAAKTYKYQNWAAIANMVGNRSEYQCFVQYQTCVCYILPNRWLKWRKEDDERLLTIIDNCTTNGVIMWRAVASQFPDKPRSSLISRYNYTLKPNIDHSPFTPEEDVLLLATVEQYGTKFLKFPHYLFPNRTLPQLRARFHVTLKERDKMEAWSVADDKKLMEFVELHGKSSWLKCSQMLQNHNRTSCRTRYLTIQRYLDKNPNSSLDDFPRKKKLRAIRGMPKITPGNWVAKVDSIDTDKDEITTQKSKQAKKRKPSVKMVQEKIQNSPLNLQESFKLECEHEQQLELERANASEDEDSAPPQKRNRSEKIYVDRLRSFELQLYHLLKYSYNYRLGVDTLVPHLSNNHYALRMAANALGYVVKNSKLDHEKNMLGVFCYNLIPNTIDMLEHVGFQAEPLVGLGYRLPLSWSTATGFRALCVQSSQPIDYSDKHEPPNAGEDLPNKLEPHNAEEHMQLKHEPPNAEEDLQNNHQHFAAVELFRKRLRVLFYKTTLFSRVDPNTISGLCAAVKNRNEIQSISTDLTKAAVPMKLKSEVMVAQDEENDAMSNVVEDVKRNIKPEPQPIQNTQRTHQQDLEQHSFLEAPKPLRKRKYPIEMDNTIVKNAKNNLVPIITFKQEVDDEMGI